MAAAMDSDRELSRVANDDDRVSQGLEVLFDGCTADDGKVLDHILGLACAGIEHEIVHAHAFHFFGERRQRVKTVCGNGEGGLLFLCDLRHGFCVLCSRGIDERLFIGTVRDPGLDGRGIFAHEDDWHARRTVHYLFHDRSKLRCIAAFVGYGNGVHPELLPHAVDLGGVDRSDLLGSGIAGFRGFDRNGKHVRVEKLFLVTEHADLFADLHGLRPRTEDNAPDRRCC